VYVEETDDVAATFKCPVLAQIQMSAFNLLSTNFLVPHKDLEIGDEAKHESDICDVRSRSIEVYPGRRRR
jgi:hypothetical protein